jgi:hypothetical protein
VDLALDCVEGDWVVRCVGCEDCYGVAWRKGIDCGFVGLGVDFVVCGVGFEGGIEVVVELADVFV